MESITLKNTIKTELASLKAIIDDHDVSERLSAIEDSIESILKKIESSDSRRQQDMAVFNNRLHTLESILAPERPKNVSDQNPKNIHIPHTTITLQKTPKRQIPISSKLPKSLHTPIPKQILAKKPNPQMITPPMTQSRRIL